MSQPRYFEAHLTVTPRRGHDFEAFSSHVQQLGWRASTFEADEVDGAAGKWFASARSTFCEDIIVAVKHAVAKLQHAGWEVERWKVEYTLWDSKLGHELGRVQ